MSRELEKQKQRGIRARQILDDSLTKEALQAIREDIYSDIAKTDHKQLEDRENSYRMLKTLEAFEKKFKRFMEKGTIAEAKLNPLQRVVKRIQEN
jgi:hypothetical protein